MMDRLEPPISLLCVTGQPVFRDLAGTSCGVRCSMATGLVSRLGGCRAGGTLCCQGLRGLPQFLLPEALQRTGLGTVRTSTST